VKAAADVIAQAALGHRARVATTMSRRSSRPPPPAKALAARSSRSSSRDAAELRRAAEAAEAAVEGAGELIGGIGEGVEAWDRAGAGVVRVVRLERGEAIDDHARRPALWAALPPDPRDLAQQIDEARPPPAAARRK
jgi:hypothetical protein